MTFVPNIRFSTVDFPAPDCPAKTVHFPAKSGFSSSAVLWREDLVFDPQTSGGLLAAVPAEEAESIVSQLKEAGLPGAVIGEVADREEKALMLQ